ncbi:MAG: hypothetical protein LBD06_04515, partial [Candidatus Accumulibacter sp.]|nr:hypothetical protein [Accumulibacter sp.]
MTMKKCSIGPPAPSNLCPTGQPGEKGKTGRRFALSSVLSNFCPLKQPSERGKTERRFSLSSAPSNFCP